MGDCIMDELDYDLIDGFENVYLEDSFVLKISQCEDKFEFLLEAVLREQHALYRSPKGGEKYCYKKCILQFTRVTSIEWLERHEVLSIDATGEQDLGNIDFLKWTPGEYHLGGDWGEVKVRSQAPHLDYAVSL